VAVKDVRIYRGVLAGSRIDNELDIILQIRESKVINSLKRMIFNFPKELVESSIATGSSIRELLRNSGEEYEQYIGELRDYQSVGTAFMYYSPRSILADGVGLGKTVEIAALLNYINIKDKKNKFLIMVDQSAANQVQNELIRFTGLNVIQLPSESKKMLKVIEGTDWDKVGGVVTKHSAIRSDTLLKWLAMNLKPDGSSSLFGTFILDESSVVKNKKTKIAENVISICSIVPRAHFMNATAFEMAIMDIYNQIDILDQSILPKKWRIEKEYCVFKMDTYWKKEFGKAKMHFKRVMVGYKNQKEFKDALKAVYFGRSKKDIGIDIPHEYRVIEVEPTKEQLIAIANGYRYREVLNCPSLIPELKIENSKESIPKLSRMVELIDGELSGFNVFIYCFHIKAKQIIYDEVLKIGRKPVILDKDTNDKEKQDIQDKFNRGEYDVLITNSQRSMNLYGGDVCIFYSCVTNPGRVEQVSGRIDRNIDDSVKTFILMLYKGTKEYDFFVDKVKSRAKDAKDLTIDAKLAVDSFIEAMEI